MLGKTMKARQMLIASVILFGTIGLFVRRIPLSASAIAAVRGVFGALVLYLLLRLRRKNIQTALLRPKIGRLIASGVFMGFNWICLFEAYNYTSIAVATLCYYFAPTIMVAASCILFRERLTLRTGLCALAALAGMVFVSGVPETGFSAGRELIGVGLGLCGAALYAAVILINKRLPGDLAWDGTIVQLFFAGLAAAIYTWIAPVKIVQGEIGLVGMLLLAVVVIVHTGAAYALYFGSVPYLSGATIAMLSYLDPVVAALISALALGETVRLPQWVGAALILGASLWSEWGRTKE